MTPSPTSQDASTGGHWPAHVRVVEVGPRDGLQNETAEVPTPVKVAFVNALSAAGHTLIEVGAFVRAERVPRMADAEAVFAGITRRAGTKYAALVPNLRGLERALVSGVDEIGIFAAASETFSRRNINQSIDDSLRTYADVSREAATHGLPVRAYLSTAFGCPFEGDVPAARVVGLAERLLDLGAYEVALSDTIGVAHPGQVTSLLASALHRLPRERLALHLHDTRGTALVNVYAGLQAGITTFDASSGGLGGCPYAPGATGNLATEDLVYLLDGLGIRSGVDLDGAVAAANLIEPHVGHALPSRVYRAVMARRALS